MSNSDTSHTPDTASHIAIVGGGSIGCNFAIAFARAGFNVRIVDPEEDRRRQIPATITRNCDDLREFRLLDVDQPALDSRIEVSGDLEGSLPGAALVQECAPEDVDIKRQLFADLDQAADSHTPLASSSSAITATEFASGLAGRTRCFVGHPGNPPTLLNVIELVGAPFTADQALARAAEIYRQAGLQPVAVHGEPKGFVFNRLQGALLREAYCLVRDQVANVADIDAIVRDGLGLRWSVIGPFETADLNRRGGIAAHAAIMGDAYAAMGEERGQHDPWTAELVRRVDEQRRKLLPLTDWDERVRWRDRQIMATLAARRSRQND